MVFLSLSIIAVVSVTLLLRRPRCEWETENLSVAATQHRIEEALSVGASEVIVPVEIINVTKTSIEFIYKNISECDRLILGDWGALVLARYNNRGCWWVTPERPSSEMFTPWVRQCYSRGGEIVSVDLTLTDSPLSFGRYKIINPFIFTPGGSIYWPRSGFRETSLVEFFMLEFTIDENMVY